MLQDVELEGIFRFTVIELAAAKAAAMQMRRGGTNKNSRGITESALKKRATSI